MSQTNSIMLSKNQDNIEIVFTLEPHPQLGNIIQVQAVEKLASGDFSMNFSKVRIPNADFYGMTPEDKEVLNIIEEYESEKLIALFYKGKKKVKTQEFLEKYCTEEILSKHVLPYVEHRVAKILSKLKGRTIYYWGDGIVNKWLPIKVNEKQSDVVFAVERTAQGMKYYVDVFHNGKQIKLQNPENLVIVNKPANILFGKSIHFFDSLTEAKKIATFFNKPEVLIPAASEELYLNKFILPLVLSHHVEGKGIEIKVEQVDRQAKLNLMTFNSSINFALEFGYGELNYPMHSIVNGQTTLGRGANDWVISVIKRDKRWEEDKIEVLKSHGLIHKQGALFDIPRSVSIEKFVSHIIPALQEEGFLINQNGIKQPFFIGIPVLLYAVKEQNDWFDLHIIVKFGAIEVPFKKLRSHIINNNNLYTLPDGTVAIIPEEWMQKLSPILDCASETKDEIRIGKYHYSVLEGFDNIGINRTGEKLKSILDSYKKTEKIVSPKTINAALRKYQLLGLQWMVALNENHFGGILADDMGLGKTVQTLAFFEWFLLNKRPEYRMGESEPSAMIAAVNHAKIEKRTPFLVVVPTSLIHNWKDEIENFTQLNTFIYAGNQRNRYIWEYFSEYEIVITTYGTIRNDRDVFSRMQFDVVVFDEAQNLKNPTSLTVKAAAELNTKQKILLTGTPIENSTSDLWSLLNIANTGFLGSFTKFQTNFIHKIEKKNDDVKLYELKKFVAPFILRRTKEEVAKELPPRHEQIVYCDMDVEQERLYVQTKSYYRNELLKTISEKGIEKSKIHILKGLLRLRQVANHPILVNEQYKGNSGKFNIIIESLSDIVNRGNKVLVFSQFVSQLRLFKEKLNELNIEYAYIDGTIKAIDRAKQVERFQKSQDCQVFLISLKAGGVGLNLTAADYVFIVDPWWNPAVERQAMDRAHRIGREKPVFVYKYITEQTVEEKIIRLQERKKQLASNLVSIDSGTWLANIDKKDLEDILK